MASFRGNTTKFQAINKVAIKNDKHYSKYVSTSFKIQVGSSNEQGFWIQSKKLPTASIRWAVKLLLYNSDLRLEHRVALAKWLLHYNLLQVLTRSSPSNPEIRGILPNKSQKYFRWNFVSGQDSSCPTLVWPARVIQSLIGYRFCWDLSWGKRQSD